MTENEKKIRGATPRDICVKAVATGVIASALCSAMAAPVSAYSATWGEEGIVYSRGISDFDVNYSLHNAGRLNRLHYNLPGIPSRNLYSYKTMALRVGGVRLSEPAALINGITFIPLRAYASAIGAAVRYNSSTKTMTVTADGLYMTASDGGYVIYANDRPIFNFSPNVVMSNGRMYVSLSSMMKITGQRSSVDSSGVSITGSYSPLKSAAAYYREDEVFWLARIITAEAKGESLIGQIAVGNVILNRVASSAYPNTIYGVIFDRKYGVQFSPILDGSIYNTPTYTATLAAKICLEGTRLSEDAMFFLNPRTAQSSWIVNNREYAYTIGGHDFYK